MSEEPIAIRAQIEQEQITLLHASGGDAGELTISELLKIFGEGVVTISNTRAQEPVCLSDNKENDNQDSAASASAQKSIQTIDSALAASLAQIPHSGKLNDMARGEIENAQNSLVDIKGYVEGSEIAYASLIEHKQELQAELDDLNRNYQSSSKELISQALEIIKLRKACEIAIGYTAAVASGVSTMPITKHRAKQDTKVLEEALKGGV